MIRAKLGPASALATLLLSAALGLVPYALRSANAQVPAWTPWTPIGTPPSARQGATAIYDPVRRRMLVFGGNSHGVMNQDVWALNLDGTPAWTPLPTSGTLPPARADHTAIYDPVDDQMVIFGGESESNTEGLPCLMSTMYNDAWTLSLAGTPTWTQMNLGTTLPCARSGHSVAYDSNLNRMLIFGGDNVEFRFQCATDSSDAVVERQDTWALYLGSSPYWRPISITYPRFWFPLRCSQLRDGTPLTDAEFVCPQADQVSRPNDARCNFPDLRQYQGAVYDPVRNRMLMLGGWYATTNANYHDFYQLVPYRTYLTNWQWLPVDPTNGSAPDHPSGRGVVTMIYASDKDRVYTFGGANLDGLTDPSFNDTWHIQLNGNERPTDWVPDAPTGGPPPARHFHNMIYDPVTERLIVFGGVDHEGSPSEVQFNDVWALNLDTTSPDSTTDLGIDSEDCPTASAVIGWTAAGDDGTTGTAKSFDLRWSSGPITDANFGTAHPLIAPTPGPAGTHETATVGIGFGHSKYFALKTIDNAGNVSGLSNVIHVVGPPNPDGCVFSVVPSPGEMELQIGSPTPSTGTAVIRYAVPAAYAGQNLELSVFDIAGRRLKQIAAGGATVGRFEATVDRASFGGSRRGAGVYYVRLQVGSKSLSRTLVLIP